MNNRLRVLRAEKNWTQADLADIVGVSRQAIIAVENGKYDPALPLAFRLARAFGRTVDDVFVWDDLPARRRTRQSSQSRPHRNRKRIPYVGAALFVGFGLVIAAFGSDELADV